MFWPLELVKEAAEYAKDAAIDTTVAVVRLPGKCVDAAAEAVDKIGDALWESDEEQKRK